jgi:hypothetical protein
LKSGAAAAFGKQDTHRGDRMTDATHQHKAPPPKDVRFLCYEVWAALGNEQPDLAGLYVSVDDCPIEGAWRDLRSLLQESTAWEAPQPVFHLEDLLTALYRKGHAVTNAWNAVLRLIEAGVFTAARREGQTVQVILATSVAKVQAYFGSNERMPGRPAAPSGAQLPPAADTEAEGPGTLPAAVDPSPAPPARRRGTRLPPAHYIMAYRLSFVHQASQSELARILTQELGRPISQPRVSRMLKRVRDFLAAGNVLPDIFPDRGRPPVTMDPSRLDLGSPRAAAHRRADEAEGEAEA